MWSSTHVDLGHSSPFSIPLSFNSTCFRVLATAKDPEVLLCVIKNDNTRNREAVPFRSLHEKIQVQCQLRGICGRHCFTRRLP